MKDANKERGANVRRNLRRWRKPLIMMMVAWLMLVLLVSIGAIAYAHSNNLSPRRVQLLAEGSGGFLVIVLAVVWLAIFVMADRKRSE